MQEPETLDPVSLIRGGALYRLQEAISTFRRNHWSTSNRILIAVTVGWFPLVALTGMSGSRALVISLLKDYRVFARVFVAVPLIIFGQRLIEERFRLNVRHFLDSGLLKTTDLPRFHSILDAVKKLRDAWIPEVSLVSFVCIGGFLFVGDDLMFDAPWAARTLGGSVSQSPAGWYFQLVTQTTYLILIGLALWKWCLYVLFFWRVSKLQLQLVPCDPDRSGGLGFLGSSPAAFVPVVVAGSTAAGSVLHYQAMHAMFSIQSLSVIVLLWVALVLLIFVGPLAIFSAKLTHLGRVGYLQYGSMAHLQAEQFHDKWVLEREAHLGELLYATDMASLMGLASSFDRMRRIKPLPVDRSTLIVITVAAAVPMLPVITTQIPLTQLLTMIFRALL
jgi:hypothetical protein